MTTSNNIANQAIQLIGDNQPEVSGLAPNFDNSPAGIALQVWYYPCVQTVARQFEFDFARSNVALATSGNVAPYPWSYEYVYPANAVEIWQLLPPAQTDPNDPLPVNWTVGNTLVSGNQQRVIWSNLQNALANVNNAPDENSWDSLFREATVAGYGAGRQARCRPIDVRKRGCLREPRRD
jgi:hypothetical protein